MTGAAGRPHHAPVPRVFTHIRKLDDCFGHFLVRVTCACGCKREIEPQALARLVGGSVTGRPRAASAVLTVRQEGGPG